MSRQTLIEYGHETTDGMWRRYTSFHAPSAATCDAVLANMKPHLQPVDLDKCVDRPVTILRQGISMVGATLVVAEEGRISVSDRSPSGYAFLEKGKRTNATVLRPETVLAVKNGYGKFDAFAEMVDYARRQVPVLTELTVEVLSSLPSHGDTIRVVALGTWTSPDGQKVPGALWLLHSYMAEDDIAEGVLLLPPSAHGVSEHGSIYGRDLLRWNVGHAADVPPVSCATALGWCDNYYIGLRHCVVGQNQTAVSA